MSEHFSFENSFLNEFNGMMKTISVLEDRLNKSVIDNKTGITYGICKCCYKMRYITPNDISLYISDLVKAFQSRAIGTNPADIEMFNVAMAKRFIEENGCEPFESSTVNNRQYVNPKTCTLQDLILLCDNDVHDVCVYSDWEIKKRISSEAFTSDMNKIKSIHFIPTMKKIVEAIPGILAGQKALNALSLNPIKEEMLRMHIETFILFACTLYASTIGEMLYYIEPSTSYTTQEIIKSVPTEDSAIMESIDIADSSPIFLVLIEGKSPFISNAIRKITNSIYSHIGISFDSSLENIYSFGGIKIDDEEGMPNVGGFRKENIHGSTTRNLNVKVFGMYIKKSQINGMMHTVEMFSKNADQTVFSKKLLLDKLFNREHPVKNPYKQICSSFVNYILKSSDVDLLGKDLPTPADFDNIDEVYPNQVFEVYSGLGDDYEENIAEDKLTKIIMDEESQCVGMVTECCLLKTNEMMIRSKLPFNCNMRDIVLQDMHPQFKDTKSALHFIMKDMRRSPIAILVNRHATIDPSIEEGVMKDCVFGLFKCHPCDISSYGHRLDEVGFNTDVNWLDKIAYGNNYLDGNYRRDIVGNNQAHPITNTLDTLYKMFIGHENSTNEELANNIVKISSLMRSIIDEYRFKGFIPNYDLVKDILAALGECFTRNMLKLYHNNTRVFDYSDCMGDTGGEPGFLYAEGFVMEDGETTASNDANKGDQSASGGQQQTSGQVQTTTPTGNKDTTVTNNNKTGVTVTNVQQLTGLKKLIQAFIRWIVDTYRKCVDKFKGDHFKETQWVEKNKALNEEIQKALDDGIFKPNINNYPPFKVDAAALIAPKFAETVNSYLEHPSSFTDEEKRKILGQMFPEKIQDQILVVYGNDKAMQTKLTNYILYSTTDDVKLYTGPLSGSNNTNGPCWKDICEDLTKTMQLLEKMVKGNADELQKASTMISKKITEIEGKKQAAEGDEAKKLDVIGGNLKYLMEVIKRVSSIYSILSTNVLTSKFYPTNYNLYRDIVQAYKTQKKSNPENPNSNGTNTQVQPQNNTQADTTNNNQGQPAGGNGNPTPQPSTGN